MQAVVIHAPKDQRIGEMTLPVNAIVTKELQLRGTFRFDPELELGSAPDGRRPDRREAADISSAAVCVSGRGVELASDRPKIDDGAMMF